MGRCFNLGVFNRERTDWFFSARQLPTDILLIDIKLLASDRRKAYDDRID